MKETKKSAQKKVDSIIKTKKRGSKKWLVIDTKDYLKKKNNNNNNKKGNVLQIDIVICLKKKNKK